MASDFMQSILDDIKAYQNKREIVHVSLIERLLVRQIDPQKMHPNPDDEFSHPDVGPSMSIIESYCSKIRFNQKNDIPIFEEPIIVQKMKDKEYLLLNGHHRWAACIKQNVKKVRALIVN